MRKHQRSEKRRQQAKPMDNEKMNPETEEQETAAEAAEQNAVQESEAQSGNDAAVAAANAKAEEYLQMAQRVQADFDNFRRRNENARRDAMMDGKRAVAAVFLDALDNLERAVSSAESADLESLKKGVELTLKQMKDAYTKLDVTAIDRTGEMFDPNLENAVLQGTADDGEPGTVCQVFQKGYKMGDVVLRHAMVKVVPED